MGKFLNDATYYVEDSIVGPHATVSVVVRMFLSSVRKARDPNISNKFLPNVSMESEQRKFRVKLRSSGISVTP